jgi:hypothetical protein
MARRNRTPSSIFTDTAELDVAVCERARVNRDRRYDGLFFSGPWPTLPLRVGTGPLTEVHRPYARQAVDVVGAPAYDPEPTWARHALCGAAIRGTGKVTPSRKADDAKA